MKMNSGQIIKAIWFAPNSIVNSHISFYITQIQFSYLISLSLVFFLKKKTLSNFCLVPNLGCMSQCLTHNFDKMVEPIS